MKNKSKFIITTVKVMIAAVLIVTAYFNSNYFIKSCNWKYRNGYSIGDWIQIGESHDAVFCYGIILVVENPVSGENGYYVNKSW